MYSDPVDKPPLTEKTLEHYGVKGMHWGERHDDKPSGRKSSAKKDDSSGGKAKKAPELSDHDLAVLKAAGIDIGHSESIKSKYGPSSLSEEPSKPPRLTEQQKTVIKGVVVAAGVAGAMYYMHKQGMFGGGNQDYVRNLGPALDLPRRGEHRPERDIPTFAKEWNQYLQTAGGRESGYTKEMVNKLSTEPTHLSAGTIFRRVSTEKETTIKPSGFFASADDADVERYKAILPVFWKKWGYGTPDGYVVQLKAKADIKAPSPRETFDMFKNMLNDDLDLGPTHALMGLPKTIKVRDAWPAAKGMDNDAYAQRAFPAFALAWNQPDHPVTKHFMAQLKEKGYNALIDMNDAGALSKKPMKLLDGSLFEIAGHEELSREAIRLAQENIQALVHALLALLNKKRGGTMFDDEKPSLDELMHYGVPGMRWGRRKQQALDSRTRILNGTAGKRDKLAVYSHMALKDVATKKRRQKTVVKQAAYLGAQKKRVESGHATVRDKLSMAMNTGLRDIVKPISK